jgi:hypothetical protein
MQEDFSPHVLFQPNGAGPVFVGCILIFGIVLLLLGVAVSTWIYCRICSRAGFHWTMGLLMLVPFGNLILLSMLAFGRWPIHRELTALRRMTGQHDTDTQ